MMTFFKKSELFIFELNNLLLLIIIVKYLCMELNYIVFDLDRTLLNDDRKISQNSIDILNLLRKEKKVIIYNTARGYGETLDVLRQFPAD